MAMVVLMMVFLSGLTGLVYQVTWQKYLSVYLGSHALSTSLTLGCFFLFLAIGYHLFGRWGHKLGKNRILTYAYVEALIGVYAIFSPKVFSFLYETWPSYPSDSFMHFASSTFFAFLLTGIPTFLMGGTIPLLTQGMSKELQEGHRVHAWVYGINTLGAFLGSLFAGFILLESFGLAQSLNLTGIINCLICVFLIIYCKISAKDFSGYKPNSSKSPIKSDRLLLTVAFLSGFLAFGLESLCIRMAGISLGSSNYTYTIIVSSFIVSIALGSFLASRSDDQNGLRWLYGNQLGLLISLVIMTTIIPRWPDLFLRARQLFATTEINFLPFWIFILFLLMLMLIVPVALMGMTLPLLFQQLKRQGSFLNETAGRMYAWNSVGAASGALFLGYLVFFFLHAYYVFMILIFISALSCYLISRITIPNSPNIKKFIPFLIALIPLIVVPKWSDYHFIPSRFFAASTIPTTFSDYNKFMGRFDFGELHKKHKILYSDYGVNTYTVVTEGSEDNRTLFVNGKPDASTAGDRFTRTLTALIPLTLAKTNEDIFIIGLGSGMSTGIAAGFQGTRSVRVSEIASGVIDSLPFFSQWNFDLDKNMDKVRIVNDDAYKVLKNETKSYDLIFSEPSNTWVTGVEKIYTKEFLNGVARRLKPGGIYSQWFPLFNMSNQSFLSIVHNFKSAFKNVTLWNAGGGASIIIATQEPIVMDLEKMRQKFEAMESVYKSIKLETPYELLYHQIYADPAVTELALAAEINHSLYHPTLAYQSGRAFFNGTRVHLEELADEQFVKNPEVRAQSLSKAPFQSSGNDNLVWENYTDQLSDDFFSKGIQFQVTHFPLVAGKLTLARSKRFPEKVTEGLKATLDETKTKFNHYHYLLGHTENLSYSNEGEKPASQLFTRFLYLLSMREKPDLERVTRHLPASCLEKSKNCVATKLKILKFKGKITAPQFQTLMSGLSEPATRQEIENLYRTNLN